MKSRQIGKDRNEQSAFAKMLEADFQRSGQIEPGAAVELRVQNNQDKEFVIVSSDYGPGVIRREELLDREGRITVNNGERLRAFFQEVHGGEKLFTLTPSGRIRQAALQQAFEQRMPVRGRVASKIKGGFEIQIGDAMAFCPASQMDNEDQAKGEMEFLITEVSGKRVIASRRAFRDEQRRKQKEELSTRLQIGDVVSGVIASLQDFGAFLDLGGVQGLIPISELSFTRLQHPSEAVKVGQELRAQVLSVDWKEDRITLSLRALLDNPWKGKLPFNEGEILEGEVDSVKNFGIFVKLPGAFHGLIPPAESGVPRGQRLEQFFQKGQQLRVMVARIDRDRERISLSVNRVQDADQRREFEQYMQKQDSDQGGMSSFGRLLQQSLDQSDRKQRK
ncbi:MAG: S1 RNA-binding domain-containing protein [Leptospirales bacterium]|nr:S1 RNA-binding domain-containing protein [Leptospirales bacterium]